VITAGDLAARLDCPVEGDATRLLTGIATIEDAGAEDLTFLANPRYRQALQASHAGAVIIAPGEPAPVGMTRIVSRQPYVDFGQALAIFHPDWEGYNGVSASVSGKSASAIIDPGAILAEDVIIGSWVVIESGVRIGAGTRIMPHSYIGRETIIGRECTIGLGAIIRHRITLGDRVVIGDGTVVGFDGFGYARTGDSYRKMPQIGTVVIEDDVEIGANACIDRATIGETRIGRGTKIDNLVQIAHGVHIGSNSVIAAQTGISGSTRIGSGVMMGGQVGLVGHIEIGDGMIVGAQAGVTKSFDVRGMISGYPARPQMEAMRIEAALSQLPALIKRIRALEAQLAIRETTSSGIDLSNDKES